MDEDKEKATSSLSGKEVVRKPGSFPIVGIGASAGGLEAFTKLLASVPANTGMGFVFVQHISASHESVLPELLSRATTMSVVHVTDGMPVLPNHVYVIPPDSGMVISQRELKTYPRVEAAGSFRPIDIFFRSLGEDQKESAIGVVLSGMGADGTIGLETIKSEGGITFAQDEISAQFNSMPRSAVVSGCVDFVLSPEEIAKELINISHHPYLRSAMVRGEPTRDEDSFRKILSAIRNAAGADFTFYKRSTIERRISRRMALRKFDTLDAYLKFLQQDFEEIKALYQDILINVTGFFRDPDTFETLKTRVFPELIKNRAPKEPIRVWVAGCSTGEEAYSIAICLIESLGDTSGSPLPIQIFATDLNEIAIEKAREGLYGQHDMVDVDAERVRRFFVKADHGFQIVKSVRDLCVFAKQDIIHDPPFSKMDIISCRNVLIYLGPVLQKKVVPLFHYALKPTGFLLLGTSEIVSAFSDLFDCVDNKNKIFSKNPNAAKVGFSPFPSTMQVARRSEEPQRTLRVGEKVESTLSSLKEADRIIQNRFGPPGVVVSDNLEVLQLRGDTSPYLKLSAGKPSYSLLKLAREGLLLELQTAIHNARKNDAAVRKQGLRVKYNGDFHRFSLEVIPIPGVSPRERDFLILFEAERSGESINKSSLVKKAGYPFLGFFKKREDHTEIPSASEYRAAGKDEADEVVKLKQELQATKEYLQSIIEKGEVTNEELQSANEEVMSSNEELQSINEEMQTAKEELQSTNEEMNTLNEELQNRNVELSRISNYLNNLLTSVNVPVIMVGNNYCIRRFTPAAERLFKLSASDIGRSIRDMKIALSIPGLEKSLLKVAGTLVPIEQEVQDNEGNWYGLRILPFRTEDNKIDGLVIVMQDIQALKTRIRESQTFTDSAEAIVLAAALKDPLRAISGFTKVIEKEYRTKLDKKLQGQLDSAVKATDKMQEVLSRLSEKL